MSIEDLRRAVERRLTEIEDEASHLRALLVLYGGTANAHQQTNVSAESAVPRTKRTTRSIPEEARTLYSFAAGRRGDVTLNELVKFADENSLPFDRGRIRQTMHNWKARGLFENPAQGVFRVTAAGLAEIENDDGASSPEPAPSPEIESSDEPNAREANRFDLLNHDAA